MPMIRCMSMRCFRGNQKKAFLAAAASITLSLGAVQAGAEEFLPVQADGMTSQVCSVTIEQGRTAAFSAGYFEARLGLDPGEIDAVTITALPPSTKGRLILDGVEVGLYDTLLRSEFDRLCYAAAHETSGEAGWFSFVPMCSKSVCATVSLTPSSVRNIVPQVKNAVCRTAKNISVKSVLDVYDANGDAVTLQLTSRPQKGRVVLSGTSYTYQPYPGSTGKDSFSVVAADSRGGLSKEAVVSVEIDKKEPAVRFSDMKGSPSEYAASMLCEKGVLTGEKVGGSVRFYPDRQMTQGEFLVTLLSAAGMTDKLEACVNTGLSNDKEIPVWMKPYVKTALENGVLEAGQPFEPDAVPTRAQAVCMVNRVGAVQPVSLFHLKFTDLHKIPDWAVSSYMTLGAHEMLGLHDSSAEPLSKLTRATAADLILPITEA